jgi:hypothetical protein
MLSKPRTLACLLAGILAVPSGGCTSEQEAATEASGSAPAALAGRIYPNNYLLVHGYATPASQSTAAGGIDPATHTSREDNFWYWKAKYSDGITSYDVPAKLQEEAAEVGETVGVYAANWDGRSKIADSVIYLENSLDAHCSLASGQSCALIGHSTGDAIIGYVLDKHRNDLPTGLPWNIAGVYVAGGAGGGTEIAYSAEIFVDDPVLRELTPTTMRGLYNHDMPAGIANVRFVGSGWRRDLQNNTPYPEMSTYLWLFSGESDGLVPFHSQAGVKPYDSAWYTAGPNSYCVKRDAFGKCGEIRTGTRDAERWRWEVQIGWSWLSAPLFAGFTVAFIDSDRRYNHSDEVGQLGTWVPDYIRQNGFRQPPPPTAPPEPPGVVTTFPAPSRKANITLRESVKLTSFRGKLFAAYRPPGNGQILTIATSADAGATWSSQVVAGATPGGAPSVAVFNGELYSAYSTAGAMAGISYSSDGLTWTNLTIPGSASGAHRALVARNGTLFLLVRGTDGGLKVARSTDGRTWTAATAALTNEGAAIPMAINYLDTTVFQDRIQVMFLGTAGRVAIAASQDGVKWSRYDLTGAHLTDGIAIVSSTSPSLAVYDGAMYLVTTTSTAAQLHLSVTRDGDTWTTATSAIATAGGVGMTAFGRALFMAGQVPGGALQVSSAEASAGTAPAWAQFPTATTRGTISMGDGPSLATFKGKLYMAFKANDSSNTLYIGSSPTGATWSAAQVPGPILGSAPSLAVYGGKLYVAMQAGDGSKKILLARSSDGLSWTSYAASSSSGPLLTQSRPTLAVFDNRLTLASSDPATGRLTIATSTTGDAAGWSPYQVAGAAALAGAVVPGAGAAALTAFRGSLYAAFRAVDGSNALTIAASTNGTTWTQYRVAGNYASNWDAYAGSAPALTVYDDKLYATYIDVGSAQLVTSVSGDGLHWSSYPSPAVLTKNPVGLAAFGSSLYVALQANDSSNRFFLSSIAASTLGGAGTSEAVNLLTENGFYLAATNGGGLGPSASPFSTTATAVGPQQTFECLQAGPNEMAFSTLNGTFITAAGGGGRVGDSTDALRANATAAASWEAFTIRWLGGNYCALQVASGAYLTAEGGGGWGAANDTNAPSATYTDATSVGPWETFTVRSR